MCLGKYFPTPEVGVIPETIKDHDVVLQGNNYKLMIIHLLIYIDNTSTDETKLLANTQSGMYSIMY